MADAINEKVAELLNLMERGVRQTRDGSHLTDEAIQKHIQQFKDMSAKEAFASAKSIKSIKQIGDSAHDFAKQLASLGINAKDRLRMASDYLKQEKDLRKKTIENLNNYIRNQEEAIKLYKKNLKAEAKANVSRVLSNGRSDRIARQGDALSEFGTSLNRLGLQRTGARLRLKGSKLKAASGALGIADAAIGILGDAVGGYMQHTAKQMEFQNKRQAIVQQKQLALTQSVGEEKQAEMSNVITKAQNEIGAKASLAVEANSIIQNAQAAATEIGLKSLTDIAGGAFEAASQQMAIQTAADKFHKHLETQEEIIDAKNELADAQLQLKKENIQAKNVSIRTKADTENASVSLAGSQETTNYGMGVAEQATQFIPLLGAGMSAANSIIKGQQAIDNARLEGINQEKNYQSDLAQTRTNIRTTLEGTAKEFSTYTTETLANMSQQIYDAEKDKEQREYNAWLKFTQNIFNDFQKAETAAFGMGRSLNFNKDQLNKYAKILANTQVTITKWGKTMEDIAKLQQSYQETTGVNKLLSDTDFNKSFANGLLIGDDIVSQMNAGMEVFNLSVSDSNDMFYEMYKSVTKMGLSGKKYGKDLVNNLKLAEKYNFKGGVKGLMEMSKWAQNVRFNTSALGGMLDKVQEGGLEGVIKQSAELQVLGGNFAMGSDPLAMAYESFNDAEGYAKRVNGMLSGLGVFNSQTGKVDVTGANRMIVNQAAKSLGMSVDDIIKQIQQEGRINQIKRSVGSKFNDEQLSAIANNATYNNGQWSVNTVNGVKSINDLTSNDVASLSGENNGGTVEENVAQMLSTAEQMKATELSISAQLQNSQWDTFRESAIQMITNIQKHFDDNLTKYENEITEKMRDVVTNQSTMISKIMGEGKDNTISALNQSLQIIYNAIGGKSDSVKSALKDINDTLQQAFPDAHTDDTDIQTLIAHMNDKNWLTAAQNDKKSDAYQVMSRLYNGLGNTIEAMGLKKLNDGRYYSKNGMKDLWALNLITHWKPSGDNGSAVMYYDQERLLKGIRYGQYGKQILNDSGYGNNLFLGEGKTIKARVNDGLISQNGNVVRINSDDQILSAKNNGPIDKMLDMVLAQPMSYNSYFNGQPYFSNNNDKLEIAPISISINGSLNVNGTNVNLTSQIQNDPTFQNALWGFISQEVSKRVNNTGRMTNPLYNRIQKA